jgi:hypothetical protein
LNGAAYSFSDPYTSSVEICKNLIGKSFSLTASRRFTVPKTFVDTNGNEFVMERSTWLSAAK